MSVQNRSVSSFTSGIKAKELIINSCNSANPDIYNIVYGFMLITKISCYSGWDGGTVWDTTKKDHVRGGGEYQWWKLWDPWENVREYQPTWWYYVQKDDSGAPTRARVGRRVFYR